MLDVVACSQERYYLTKQLWGRSMVLAYHVAPGPEPYVRRRKPKMQLPSIPTGATTHLSLSIEKKSPATFIGTLDIMHQIGSLRHHPDLDCIRYLHPCP